MLRDFTTIKSVIEAFVSSMKNDNSFSFLLERDAGGICLFEETEKLTETSKTPWVNISLAEKPVQLLSADPMNSRQVIRVVYRIDLVFCCSHTERDLVIWGSKSPVFVGLLDFYSLMIDFLEANNSLSDLVEDLLDWPTMECDILPPIPTYQFYKAGMRMSIQFYKDISNV